MSDSPTTRSVTITVPLVPPSVNHYKKPRRGGYGYYVTKEAQAFKQAVGVCAGRQRALVGVRRYEVEVHIYLGAGDRGDVDNFGKVVLDGLQESGVIHSDAAVTDLILRKRRDRQEPRTEITVRETRHVSVAWMR